MKAPWYVVLWRLIWAGPTYVAWGLLIAVSFVGWGKDAARRVINL